MIPETGRTLNPRIHYYLTQIEGQIRISIVLGVVGNNRARLSGRSTFYVEISVRTSTC